VHAFVQLLKINMPALFVILTRNEKQDHRLGLAGITTREIAHTFGVPHGAVQLAVIIQKELAGNLQPHILLHQRSKYKKIDPEKWDICGGHLEADQTTIDVFHTNDWSDTSIIEELFWKTALREINEEVLFLETDFRFQKSNLQCFGEIGMFESGFGDKNSINREYSSLFLGFTPPSRLRLAESDEVSDFVHMEDTVNIGGITQEAKIANLKLLTLDQLILNYQKTPSLFADGVARVLIRLAQTPELEQKLRILISKST